MRIPKLLVMLSVLMLSLMLSHCGGGEETTTEEPAESGQEETATEETTETETAEAPVEETVPLYPEGTLNPAEVTVDTPVSAQSLFDAYYAWDGMEVTISAYPYFFYGDSTTVETELDLVADPESDEELVTVEFAESQDVVLYRTDPITVRGIAENYWTGDILLKDAELVESTEPAGADFETSPYAYDGTTPIPVQDFHQMFTAWMDKEVTVEGYYHSTTTSTTDYGTTIRIDLAEPGDIYTKYVACEMAGEISEASDSALVENREGVQIRGTIAGESFDMVGLEGCTLVNR